MGDNASKTWVRLQIEKSSNKSLKTKAFWWYVKCLLIPALGLLLGFCVYLNGRIDSLMLLLTDCLICG